MICITKFDPAIDNKECSQFPEFNSNLEEMLMSGQIGEQANNSSAYNNLNLDEIGDRPMDIFDAADGLRGIKQNMVSNDN